MLCWMIAGFWIAFFGFQFLFLLVKVRTTRIMDFIVGLIGVLVVYTIFVS